VRGLGVFAIRSRGFVGVRVVRMGCLCLGRRIVFEVGRGKLDELVRIVLGSLFPNRSVYVYLGCIDLLEALSIPLRTVVE
jgi:hypothetical protein